VGETPVDMKDVISDTLSAMGQVFREKNIEVVAAFRTGLARDRRPRPDDPGDAQPLVECREVLRLRARGRIEVTLAEKERKP
jgi:hypothetical protein